MATLHLGKTGTAVAAPNGSEINPLWISDDPATLAITGVSPDGLTATLLALKKDSVALRFHCTRPDGSATIEAVEIVQIIDPPVSAVVITITEN